MIVIADKNDRKFWSILYFLLLLFSWECHKAFWKRKDKKRQWYDVFSFWCHWNSSSRIFQQELFPLFFYIKHLPEMFYLKTGERFQRKIFFRLVRSNHRIIFVINTRGVAKIQIDPFKISSKTLTMTSSLWRWSHYRDVRESMKNFKYCAISLNILHTSGLCGILRFTAPLILISKKFQSKYIHTVNSALCAPIVRAAIKRLLLGAWQTCELPKNLIRPPG